jgi:hypothetical protein
MRLGCSGGMMNGANSSGELLLDDSGCEYWGLTVLLRVAWSVWLLYISGDGHVVVLLAGSEYIFINSNGACSLMLLRVLDLERKSFGNNLQTMSWYVYLTRRMKTYPTPVLLWTTRSNLNAR